MDIFFRSFINLIGDGLAFAMRAINIQDVMNSLLSICLPLRNYYIRVSRLPFPTMKGGLLPDDERSDADWQTDIENLEKQFGLTPNFADTLEQRATVSESMWGLIGSQGRGYIQDALTRAGIPVFVKENLPAIDLSALGSNQYGEKQYGFNSYGSYNLDLLGNGRITTDENVYDPVLQPLNIIEDYGFKSYGSISYGSAYSQWQNVFIVEGQEWQQKAELTQSQYDTLVFILLKIKPAHTLAFLNIDIK